MSILSNYMMMAAATTEAAVERYTIDNSCIFERTDATKLERTQASSVTNGKKWTLSFWFKRSSELSYGGENKLSLLTAYKSNGEEEHIALTSDDKLKWYASLSTTSVDTELTSAAVLRDIGAWYHLVIAKDTTQGTETNRNKMWLNGVAVGFEAGGDYATEDSISQMNVGSATKQFLGSSYNTGKYGTQYMAEVHFIDGTCYDESDFGKTNETGVWEPIEVEGLSYGDNGFYADFASSGDLGNDVSGNNNDFTSTNLSTTNQSTDTPTNNHCTWSYLNASLSITLSNGARTATHSSAAADQFPIGASTAMQSGKWYAEFNMDDGSAGVWSGLLNTNQAARIGRNGHYHNTVAGETSGYTSGVSYQNNGSLWTAGSEDADWGDTYTTGDVISIAVDADTGKVWFGKNNTWQASGDPENGTNPATTLTMPVTFFFSIYKEDYLTMRAAQAEWSYSAPTGFNALNSNNLDAPAITDSSTNFQALGYTGSGGTVSRTFSGNSNMKPDVVWIKGRSETSDHNVFDAPRGVQKNIQMDNEDAETTDSNSLTAFETDGFALGSSNDVNKSDVTYVAWAWNTGNSGSSNTDGTINTTTTYVDTSAGISISTYTGNGSDDATIGHGLGVTPKTVLILPRSNGDHRQINNWEYELFNNFSEDLKLNENSAAESSSNRIKSASSTTFTMGTDVNVNGSSRTYAAYAFAEVDGFSRFGSYIGNGNALGPINYCGFSPSFILVTRTDSGDERILLDNARNTYNPAALRLYSNNTDTEVSSTAIDFLGNGFKVRAADGGINANAGNYTFMAFAAHPFGGTGVAPATAR